MPARVERPRAVSEVCARVGDESTKRRTMTASPWVTMPIGVAGFVLLACLIIGGVNLATLYTIRVPQRVPFPTIRRRALSIRDIVIPGFLALLTGLLISLAASFMFDGFTRRTAGAFEVGAGIFVVVLVVFTVIAAIWFRSGMEIGDLAKEPFTISAAATSLHGTSPDDASTLRGLHRNDQAWKQQEGALAFSPGTGRISPAADRALAAVMPGGSRPRRSRWRLLGALLRVRWGMWVWPAAVVVCGVVAWAALHFSAGSEDRLELAAMRATIVTITALALASVVLLWWSEILCSARRYRVGRLGSVCADIALASAGRRTSTASDRERAADALPGRIDRWGAVVLTAVIASTLSLGAALRFRRA